MSGGNDGGMHGGNGNRADTRGLRGDSGNLSKGEVQEWNLQDCPALPGLMRQVKSLRKQRILLSRHLKSISDTSRADLKSLVTEMESALAHARRLVDGVKADSAQSARAAVDVLDYLARLDKLICSLMEQQVKMAELAREVYSDQLQAQRAKRETELEDARDRRSMLLRLWGQLFAAFGAGGAITYLLQRLLG